MFPNESWANATVAIIVLTSIVSILGLRDPAFRERHLFSVPEILAGKQYHRLFTSAFLHADWSHLLLNMISLYLFGRSIEWSLGVGKFLLIYFAAILGGSVLSLWIHRHHEYQAYGASGGVCGVIFSYILLFPGGAIVLFPVPVPIPGWLYAILFLVGSVLALKRQTDNIGHDAHVGGAIIGLWTTAALEPDIVRLSPKLFLSISAVSILLFAYLAKNPMLLPLSSFLPTRPHFKEKPDKQRGSKDQSSELDPILEKISRSGIESLSSKERALLNSVSERYRRRSDSQKPGSR
jgi:membrane associated rhomboid family serine protease